MIVLILLSCAGDLRNSKLSRSSLVHLVSVSPMLIPVAEAFLDTESIKLWVVPVIVSRLKQITLSRIFFLAENVIPKSKDSKKAITSCFQVDPIVTRAHDLSPCKRSRLIWANLTGTSCAIEPINLHDYIESGWEPLWSSNLPGSKFGTFLRPFQLKALQLRSFYFRA